MFIVGIVSWWYGAGWLLQFSRLRDRLAALSDYFSIDLLLKTLFQPYRQISAGSVSGSLSVQLRAFFDKLISRCIGAGIRLVVMVIGLGSICVTSLFGSLLAIFWGIIPLLPFLCIGLALVGWTPWHL